MSTELNKKLEDAKSFITNLRKARSSAKNHSALVEQYKEDQAKLADIATVFAARNGWEKILVKYTKMMMQLRKGGVVESAEVVDEPVVLVKKKKSKKSKK